MGTGKGQGRGAGRGKSQGVGRGAGRGAGSMTGGGRGFCNPSNAGYNPRFTVGFGYGRGLGLRRVFRGGFGYYRHRSQMQHWNANGFTYLSQSRSTTTLVDSGVSNPSWHSAFVLTGKDKRPAKVGRSTHGSCFQGRNPILNTLIKRKKLFLPFRHHVHDHISS